VWGVEKMVYTFDDLKVFLANGGSLASENEEDILDRKGKKKQKSEPKKEKRKKSKLDEKRHKKKHMNMK
jgi:hypothetical protein